MKVSTLVGTTIAVIATAVTGSVATQPGSTWYRHLDKPSWQPPPAAFPIVWTGLYADIAVTSALSLSTLDGRGSARERRRYTGALAANLSLNAVWSWLFWRSRRPWLAAAECALLAASSADLVRRSGRASGTAGAALAPYAVWCGFATVLSGAIARRNPRR